VSKNKLSEDRVKTLIKDLKKKNYFDIKGKKRKDIDILLKDQNYKDYNLLLHGIIDYRVYYKLKTEQIKELFFIFIDVKNATTKIKICEYLKSRNLMSYNLASDMDILVTMLTASDNIQEFWDDIRKKFGKTIEFHTFRAKRPICLERKKIRDIAPYISDIELNSFLLSKIQMNYADNDLKDLYKKLKDEKILVGHSIIYNFAKLNEVRDFALFFNINKSIEKQFLQMPEIFENIIDLCEVEYKHMPGGGAEKDYTSFYAGAQYLGLLEFSSPMERDTWEKMVGTIFADSNVFFFPISSIVFPGPYGISDLEFGKRCDDYSCENIIPFGTVVYDGITINEEEVGLINSSLNNNGLILGQPKTGKTTPVLLMISHLIKKGLTVHLLNLTKDDIHKFNKKFENKTNIHNIRDLEKSSNGFSSFKKGFVHLYSLNEHKISDLECSNIILNAIKKTPSVISNGNNNIKKSRILNHVIIIDEAHDIFAGPSNKQIINDFSRILQKLSHYGIALYIVTQKLSHLKINNKESLIPSLKNRIIYRVDKEEASDASELLSEDGVDSIYVFEKEIPSLDNYNAFVRFTKPNGEILLPIKIRFKKG
jgi:hypothetical protein